MHTKTEKAWDWNPTNNSTCLTHGPYIGLICTPCVVTLPTRQDVARRDDRYR
jgi:hypothetical protein